MMVIVNTTGTMDGTAFWEDDALIDDYNISTIYVYRGNGQTVEITATCMEWYQYYEWGEDEWRDTWQIITDTTRTRLTMF